MLHIFMLFMMYHINDVMLYKLQNFDLFRPGDAQAYPVTGSVATAAAALLEDSIFPEARRAAGEKRGGFSMNREIYRVFYMVKYVING